jgi:hypothetical protein
MDTAGVPAFGSTGEALGVMMSAMRYLADADHAELPAADKAEALIGLEQLDAAEAAARAGLLAAFDAAADYELDGQGSGGTWLRHRSRITKAEAAAHRAWVRCKAEHPLIVAAMRDGVISKSWVKRVMAVAGKIPEAFRQEADKIIVTAAGTGADLPDLVRLAAEILDRTAGPDPDNEKGFADRNLRLHTTFDGAGVLAGELSPECAAAVRAVLDKLAERAGKEDTRSHGERMHDALEDAMLRLLGSELVPARNGHPVQGIVHIGLGDLLPLDGGSVLAREWITRQAGQWAGWRAATAEQPGDGGAWAYGSAAQGIACDAVLFPIVTGHVDPAHMEDLVRICVELDGYLHAPAGGDGDAADEAAGPVPDRAAHAARIQDLMEQVIGKAVDILSGEPGLAAHLWRNLMGQVGLGGPSLPLDVGDTDHIPWWLRRAVHTRNQRCRWPGGCDQPAAACQPHHVVHRAGHGATKIGNLIDLCHFHHLVVIHRWGWTLKVCGDGTLEARSPDGRMIKEHSRPPPPRPG